MVITCVTLLLMREHQVLLPEVWCVDIINIRIWTHLLVWIDGSDDRGIRLIFPTCVIWIVIRVITVLRDHLDPLNQLHAAILAVNQVSLEDDILFIITLEPHHALIFSIDDHCGLLSISDLMQTVLVLLTATLFSTVNWKSFAIVVLYPNIWWAHYFVRFIVVFWRWEVTSAMLVSWLTVIGRAKLLIYLLRSLCGCPFKWWKVW